MRIIVYVIFDADIYSEYQHQRIIHHVVPYKYQGIEHSRFFFSSASHAGLNAGESACFTPIRICAGAPAPGR